MRAYLVKFPGAAENLVLVEVDNLEPKADELLVKVHATALNRADILQRKGQYPPPEGASPVLGLEIAGEVARLGSGVNGYKIGDKVFGLIPGGGYAEYALIHKDMANLIPSGMNYQQAASIPEVFLTAFQSLVWLGDLQEGKSVLIHAGASGVGTAAIQLAKHRGAKVIVTASQKKHEMCLKLGADYAIDYKEGSFASKVNTYTDGEGVDLIIDFIGKPYFEDNLETLKIDGILVSLAAMGGSKVQDFDLGALLKKRLHLKGSTLRSRPLEYQIRLNKEFFKYAMPLFISGVLQPVIDKVYNWKDVKVAHEYMESNKNTGKLVLVIEHNQ